MAETKPIPVRLSPDLIKRLDEAAKKIGNTRAGIIKFCVDTFLTHFEKHGRAGLPPDWEEILAFYDGRTREAKSEAPSNVPREEVKHQRGHKPTHAEQEYLEGKGGVITKRDRAFEGKLNKHLKDVADKTSPEK